MTGLTRYYEVRTQTQESQRQWSTKTSFYSQKKNVTEGSSSKGTAGTAGTYIGKTQETGTWDPTQERQTFKVKQEMEHKQLKNSRPNEEHKEEKV